MPKKITTTVKVFEALSTTKVVVDPINTINLISDEGITDPSSKVEIEIIDENYETLCEVLEEYDSDIPSEFVSNAIETIDFFITSDTVFLHNKDDTEF
jgi:hypothetical protein